MLMTSAGTMTNAALLTGASHQQIGRWLRGENKRPIPEEAKAAIDYAFNLHKQEARRIAKAHGLPFVAVIPLMSRHSGTIHAPTSFRF